MVKGHETKKKEKKIELLMCAFQGAELFGHPALQLQDSDQSSVRKVSSSDISSACYPNLVVLLFGIDVGQVCFNRGAGGCCSEPCLHQHSCRGCAWQSWTSRKPVWVGSAQINANCNCLPLACYSSPLRLEQC